MELFSPTFHLLPLTSYFSPFGSLFLIKVFRISYFVFRISYFLNKSRHIGIVDAYFFIFTPLFLHPLDQQKPF